jgi:outer membrane protein OmpA-like peptidoglycan-associated protein
MAAVLLCAAALAVSGCTQPADDADPARREGATASPQEQATPSSTRPASLPEAITAEECMPGPGRVVTQLPDVRVQEVHVPATTAPRSGARMPGFTIPGHVVDAGCIIRYPAPGGCLGAVEITGAHIPAASIPRSVLPAATMDGRVLAERVFESVTVPGARAGAVSAPQVCQIATGGRLPSVTRPGIVRQGLSRNGAARPGGSRADVTVDTVRLEPVRLPDVDVDPERLGVVKLRDEVTRIGEGDAASFVAPADVLFDVDRATLRPAAGKALTALARQLEGTSRPLRVEGHTDSTGAADHNQSLSEQRAATVAAWLARHAGIARARMTVTGFGERSPAYPNSTASGRQGNRRVVISVRP